jgi:hypothetical protein
MKPPPHTPGPWKFRKVHSINNRPLTALLLETQAPNQPMNDPCILAVREDWMDWLVNMPGGQANALLIASAPDLLAALEALVKDATECEVEGEPSQVDGIQWDDVLAARAAITKARG